MMQPLPEFLLQTSTSAIVIVSLLKATIVLAIAQLAVTVTRDLSAATRHLILTAGIAAFLVIPLLSLFAPRVGVTVAKAPATIAAPATSIEDMVTPPPSSPQPSTAAAPSQSTNLPAITLPRALAAAWLLVSLFLLSRLMRSAIRVRSIVRNASVPSPRLLTLLDEVRSRVAVSVDVRLLQSDRVDVPMVWGIRQGTLLLPEVAEEWTDEHLRATLIHELGHLQRLDYASLALMNVVSSLLWFHPQIWTARSRALTEGERACDDLVLRAGERASEYASHLLHVARLMPRREPLAALLAMSRPSQLEGRMYAILSTSVNRQSIGGKSLMFSIATFLAVVVPLSIVQPVVAATEQKPMLIEMTLPSIPHESGGGHDGAGHDRKRKSHGHTVNVTRDTGTCADYSHQFGSAPVQVKEEQKVVNSGRSLNVTASKNGGVRVRRSTSGNFTVLACKVAAADNNADASQLLSRVELHERAGSVTVTGPEEGNWAVNLIVEVPDGSAIDLNATNGPIAIHGIDATVNAEVVNGPIALSNSRGTIKARSQNGPLAIANMSGDIDAAVQNGPLTIELDEAWSGGELRASVENGPLALTVPKSFSSGVEVKTTGHGPFACSLPACKDLDDDITSPRRSPRNLSFGAGPARVFIEAGNGPVTISQ